MAAGDLLLDDDGNVILEDDGDALPSDGAGDDCCCGEPDPCAASAASLSGLLEDGGGSPTDGDYTVTGGKVRDISGGGGLGRALAACTLTVTVTHTNPSAGCIMTFWPLVNCTRVTWDGGAADVSVSAIVGDEGPKTVAVTLAAGDFIQIVGDGCTAGNQRLPVADSTCRCPSPGTALGAVISPAIPSPCAALEAITAPALDGGPDPDDQRTYELGDGTLVGAGTESLGGSCVGTLNSAYTQTHTTVSRGLGPPVTTVTTSPTQTYKGSTGRLFLDTLSFDTAKLRYVLKRYQLFVSAGAQLIWVGTRSACGGFRGAYAQTADYLATDVYSNCDPTATYTVS